MENTYEVWRIQNIEVHGSPVAHVSEPYKTNHTIKARTQKEAEYKLQRKFKNAGFHLMCLFVRRRRSG